MTKKKILFFIFSLCCLYITPTVQGQLAVTDGLIAWYKLNGNGNDAGPYGIHGIANGSSVTAATDRFGVANRAILFSGNGRYDMLGEDAYNFLSQMTGDFTVAAWVKLETVDQNASYPTLFNKSDGYGNDELQMLIHDNNYYRSDWEFLGMSVNQDWPLQVGGHMNQCGRPDFNSPGDWKVWHHYGISVLNGNVTCYLDGSPMSIHNLSFVIENIIVPNFDPDNSGTFSIGAEVSGANCLNGYMDDLVFYNRALTDIEVIALAGGATTTNELKVITSVNNQTNTISLSVSGSTQPYQSLWSDGSTNFSRSGLPAGDYSVLISDANGCQVARGFHFNCLTQDSASALSFDGVDDQVYIQDSNSKLENSALTFECWVKLLSPITITWPPRIIMASNWSNGWGVGINQDGSFVFTKIDVSGVNSTLKITDTTTWHHLAVTHDGTNVKFYLDNQSETIYYPETFASGGSPYYLGNRPQYGNEYANILLDEVRVWKTVRSSGQISAKKDCPLFGNENNLVLYYDFNQGFSCCNNSNQTTLLDKTQNALNGTLEYFGLNGCTSNWISANPTNCLTPSSTSIPCSNFTADAGLDQIICSGFKASLDASLPNGATGIWSKISGTGTISDINSASTQINGIQPGTSVFAWQIQDTTLGCTATDFVEVQSAGTPYGVSAYVNQFNEVFISWQSIASPDSFWIRVTENCSSTGGITYKIPGNLRNITLTGLKGCTNYCVRIRTKCEGPNNNSIFSAWSAMTPFTTSGPVSCAAITNLVITPVQGCVYNLDWSSGCAAADSFRVRYRVNNGAWQITIPGTTSTNRNLTLGQGNWEFRVQTWCNGQNVATSATYTYNIGSCVIPYSASVSQNTGCNYKIQWETCAPSDSFRVRYRVGANAFVSSPYTTGNFVNLNLGVGTWEYRVQSWCGGILMGVTPSYFTTIGSCRSAGVSHEVVSNMVLFPNPTSSRSLLNFSSEIDGDYTIAVSDISGRVLNTIQGSAVVGENTAEILVDGYAKGVYFVGLTLNGETRQIKLTVQ